MPPMAGFPTEAWLRPLPGRQARGWKRSAKTSPGPRQNSRDQLRGNPRRKFTVQRRDTRSRPEHWLGRRRAQTQAHTGAGLPPGTSAGMDITRVSRHQIRHPCRASQNMRPGIPASASRIDTKNVGLNWQRAALNYCVVFPILLQLCAQT